MHEKRIPMVAASRQRKRDHRLATERMCQYAAAASGVHSRRKSGCAQSAMNRTAEEAALDILVGPFKDQSWRNNTGEDID